MKRCDAHHDGHDCAERGACTRAMIAMCERTTDAPAKRAHTDDVIADVAYSIDPTTWKAKYA